MLLDSPQQLQRWVKIVPHIVDTGLLGCTVALTMEIHQYPFVDAWLTAKVIVLVLYILAGSIALKRGKTKTIRTMAFSFAVLCYLYLGSIALTHHPLGALLILS